ncbi:hypothetical protein SAMN02746041_02202 [Desulfacinum hydrothermale DSM 13146]|uniref:LSM domain-containing protein n=1 Tax=Desulfacinum hydrothermale DSM 13146 TaxID=1121390 RepID=A0A1W1XNN7_9BACT|nr:hypothetical protein [Desulfacinum hydrothermale]SMC25128.1 hypothetical protein SAMN02746041_02202 [Desulfacinum hydrothermale DSM 13146]
MSGIVVEKKDGKTVITVVQKDEKPQEKTMESDRTEAANPPEDGRSRRTFLHDVLGRRLIFHLTTGEEVEGILDGFDKESLRVEDAYLMSAENEIRCDWMILERRQLVSVYPPARTRSRRRDA